MGNCQAIDSASLVIQHPNGRVEKMYWPITASEIMKINPGHYVALLLTTTLYSSAAAAAGAAAAGTAAAGVTVNKNTCHSVNNNKNTPLRITRIKLLRPTDTLVLGHVYRLVASQEVMKGLLAKKQAKIQQQPMEKIKQVKHERHRSRSHTPVINSIMPKSRGWQPSLKSISEAGS